MHTPHLFFLFFLWYEEMRRKRETGKKRARARGVARERERVHARERNRKLESVCVCV